jgi:methylmalonyl-CoA mutase
LFQEIEAAGGLAAALERGSIQAKVATARAERERALAEKKQTLIGASEYPSVTNVPVLDVPRVILPDAPAAVSAEPLSPVRLAAPFEAASG